MKTLLGTDLLAVGRGAATYKITYSDLNQVVSVGATPPTGPVKGSAWLNTDNGILYVYTGSVWVGK
jgi:hypothetical protein